MVFVSRMRDQVYESFDWNCQMSIVCFLVAIGDFFSPAVFY